jgi:hypothetical protein
MKKSLPGRSNLFIALHNKALKYFVVALLASALSIPAMSQQGLIFKNPVLISGTAGQDGAVYRFSLVTSNVDALVKINGRSSSSVKLLAIDLNTDGWDKAFQPQVTCNDNNTTPSGIYDWWMEFQVTFVKTNTSTPVSVSNFSLTAIDIDGNGDKINEWVNFYNLKSSVVESNSLLSLSALWETILGLLQLDGKQFSGPTTNFTDIDTSATSVMATANYENINQFRIRTGGHSTGVSGAADRMYSFWFKSFNFQAPVATTLPITLASFTATKSDSKVVLNWSTSMEKNVSHFSVERSTDGANYSQVGIVMTDDNSNQVKKYSFSDDIKNVDKQIVYYRLGTIDMDGQDQKSAVRIIRMEDQKTTNAILAYPNPATTDLRITLPSAWQNKQVVIDLINTSGQVAKHIVCSSAGQTQDLSISDISVGMYIVRATNGTETSVQRIIKSK